jgi:hypothetical protein
MQELTDRQLLDRELVHFTAQGWQIVSQSDTAFQVVLPHVVDGALTAVFVVIPLILGVLVSLFSIPFGSALFWIALIIAALLMLGHFSARPKLLYITADQLRAPASSATVIRSATNGITVCSVSQKPARTDATACKNCNAQFVKA